MKSKNNWKKVSYSVSRTKPKEQAQSSKAKEEPQTIVKPAAITRRKKKEGQTRRRSAHQEEQKRKCEGDAPPMKNPPVKKPRQNCHSHQAKKEEKKQAEKEHADELAYISQAICSAGPDGCYHEGQNVFTSGHNKNGSNCCTCRRMFHDVCLHVFEGNFYCTNCYKNDVVSMCATETLFDDVFKVEFLSTQSPEQGLSTRKNTTDVLKFVDNFLLANKLLTFSQYEDWQKKTKEEIQKEPATQKNLELDEKIRRKRVKENY